MKTKILKRFPLFCVFLAVGFASCDFDADSDNGGGGGGGTGEIKTFWAVNLTNNNYYKLNAKNIAKGSTCVVWAETDSNEKLKNNITVEVAKAVASKFDGIYSKITGIFGDAKDIDVDDDGKITLLLLDIQDGYVEGSSSGYTGGYFDITNILTGTHSNNCDMLYIDTYPSVTDPEDPQSRGTYATCAHEFQHLINFAASVRKWWNASPRPTYIDSFLEDTWLNEGLSTAAEFLFEETSGAMGDGFNYDPEYPVSSDNPPSEIEGDPCDRIYYYNLITGGLYREYEDCDEIQNAVEYFYQYFLEHGIASGSTVLWDTFFVWDYDDGYRALADYSTDYLFFQWLRLQAAGGKGIYTKIINSDFVDYRAVLDAAHSEISALNPSLDLNSTSSCQEAWSNTLKTWFLATLKNNGSGLEGYKGEIKTYPYTYNKADWNNKTYISSLYPGEGVFSDVASGQSSPVVRYPTASANAAYLVLNTNDNLEGNANSSGTIASIESAGVSLGIRPARQRVAASAWQASPFKKIFPVDVVLPVSPLESLPGLLKVPAGE